MARSLRAPGARPGQLLHNAYGYGLFTGGLGVHAGAELLGCTVVPVSGGMTERQVRLITDFRPDIITVTPTYMLALADEMDRHGIDPRTTSLKVGIFGASPGRTSCVASSTTGPPDCPLRTHSLGGWCGGGSCASSVPLWPGFQLLRMALLSR